ncbi:MAG: hypothetical protein ABSB19_13420 [Methylomonas sp.]|jgi:hypothetical protein
MWFNPTELLTQAAKPPANFANLANFTTDDQQNVPEISKISRISKPVEVNPENGPDEISRISEISSGLSVADRKKLLAYMAAIDERDPEMIEDLLTVCAKNPKALVWALSWADKVLAKERYPVTKSSTEKPIIITCNWCQNFRSYNDHGGGAGSCFAGVTPMGACHWSETSHDCDKYQKAEK